MRLASELLDLIRARNFAERRFLQTASIDFRNLQDWIEGTTAPSKMSICRMKACRDYLKGVS